MNKDSIDQQYKVIDDYLDVLGFSPYQDGSGDYGERRLWIDDVLYRIWIHDMVGDYWSNEYPDNQFYLQIGKDFSRHPFETIEELNSLLGLNSIGSEDNLPIREQAKFQSTVANSKNYESIEIKGNQICIMYNEEELFKGTLTELIKKLRNE